MNTIKFDNYSTADMIDELGNLNAAMKEYKARQDALNKELKNRMDKGEEAHGASFIAVKSVSSRTSLDTKKAAAFIETSVDKEFQSEFYTTTEIETLRISVRPVWAEAAE